MNENMEELKAMRLILNGLLFEMTEDQRNGIIEHRDAILKVTREQPNDIALFSSLLAYLEVALEPKETLLG